MSLTLLAFVVGVLCGFLMSRQHRRASADPLAQPAATQAERDTRDPQAIDAGQSNIKFASLGDDMTALRLRQKLRREEERQRPQEGRN